MRMLRANQRIASDSTQATARLAVHMFEANSHSMGLGFRVRFEAACGSPLWVSPQQRPAVVANGRDLDTSTAESGCEPARIRVTRNAWYNKGSLGIWAGVGTTP
jgi:hypothetical protein